MGILLVNVSGVSAQPLFPSRLDWQVRFRDEAVCIGPTWVEEDEPVVAVGLQNRAVLVRNGLTLWQSPDLGGKVTALFRVDFGIGDGFELIAAVTGDQSGELIEFKGAGLQDTTRFTLFGFDTIQAENQQEGAFDYYDYRTISWITALPVTQPDSSKSLVLFNRVEVTNNYPEAFFKVNGRACRVSLDNGEVSDIRECGYVSKAYPCLWDSSSQIIFQGEDFADHGPFGGAFNPRGHRYVGLLDNNMSLDLRGLSENFGITEPKGKWSAFDTSGGGNPSILMAHRVDDVDLDTTYVSMSRIGSPGLNIINTTPYIRERMVELAVCNDRDEEPFLFSIGSTFHVSPVDSPQNVTEYTGPLGEIVTIKDAVAGDFNLDGIGEYLLLTRSAIYHYSIGSLGVIDEEQGMLPTALLLSAFPNPFNSSTTISYSVGQVSKPVRLAVYDMNGRLVADLLGSTGISAGQGFHSAAEGRATVHSLLWDADGLPGGLYLIRLESGNEVKTIKTLLMK